MSYVVLARKFRPQSFDAVVGQPHITKALVNALSRKRVPHALLFSGPRGVGKTTTARVLAKALNCQESTEERRQQGLVEPCGKCTSCLEIAASSSLAVWEIDGASNNSVDNVRELISSLHSAPPPGSRYKIYIIDEVHMLSTSAFNALLKSLEEPPANTVFIFATTEPQKIPETVISRCQRFDFRKIAENEIEQQLAEIVLADGSAKVAPEVLAFIARRSRGGMRDAQSMLDRLFSYGESNIELEHAYDVFGLLGFEFYLSLGKAIVTQDLLSVLNLVSQAFERNLDLRSFLDELLGFWRNTLVLSSLSVDSRAKFQITELSQEQRKQLEELAGEVEPFHCKRLYDVAEQCVNRALTAFQPRFALEAGLIEMATLPQVKSLPAVVERLESYLAGKGGRAAKRVPANLGPSKLTEAPRSKVSGPLGQWQEFVSFVASNNHPALSAHLRRVTADVFRSGSLKMSAEQFDAEALGSKENQASLKRCLTLFSGVETWQVEIVRAKLEQQVKRKDYQDGSLAAKEKARREAERADIIREARDQSAVKTTLKVFEGSAVEEVSPLAVSRRSSD